MTEIVGVIRAQLDSLLELLEQSETNFCRSTLEAAHAQAADYRKRARRVARERARRAVSDERERMERVDAALEEAGSLMLGKSWTIEHPADWPEDERERARARAKVAFGVDAQCVPADELDCGLRVVNGGTLLDMSPQGILAQRRAIEADLLAEFGAAPGADERSGQ